jgi:hypothetical protein
MAIQLLKRMFFIIIVLYAIIFWMLIGLDILYWFFY